MRRMPGPDFFTNERTSMTAKELSTIAHYELACKMESIGMPRFAQFYLSRIPRGSTRLIKTWMKAKKAAALETADLMNAADNAGIARD